MFTKWRNEQIEAKRSVVLALSQKVEAVVARDRREQLLERPVITMQMAEDAANLSHLSRLIALAEKHGLVQLAASIRANGALGDLSSDMFDEAGEAGKGAFLMEAMTVVDEGGGAELAVEEVDDETLAAEAEAWSAAEDARLGLDTGKSSETAAAKAAAKAAAAEAKAAKAAAESLLCTHP